MTDGVFAARGDIAPLAEYQRRARRLPGAMLLVDDAHGLGVLGQHGRGTLEHAGTVPSRRDEGLGSDRPFGHDDPIAGPRLFSCGTLSKALGGYGGIIAGSRRVDRAAEEHVALVRRGQSAAAAADWRPPPGRWSWCWPSPQCATRLRENVERLRAGLIRLGLPCEQTPSPIICLRLGTAERMRGIQAGLMAAGHSGRLHGGLFRAWLRGRVAAGRLRHAHGGNDRPTARRDAGVDLNGGEAA